jgi:hypothetical protein
MQEQVASVAPLEWGLHTVGGPDIVKRVGRWSAYDCFLPETAVFFPS